MFRPTLFLRSSTSFSASFLHTPTRSTNQFSQTHTFKKLSFSTSEKSGKVVDLKDFNSEYNFKQIKVQPVNEQVAKVIMAAPPVNSMTLEFMDELTGVLTILEEQHKDIKGVLLTSGLAPHIFSAGLDLKTMHNPEEEKAKEFWRGLHRLFHRLYMSPMAMAAVISGHAPAGGCFLSLCCDVRVMSAGKSLIGLNEVKLGIVPPWWFSILMKETVGSRQAEKHLQIGSLLPADQALAIGLVDHVSENAEETAIQELNKFMSVPEAARVHSKLVSRQPLDSIVAAGLDEDVDNFWEYIRADTTQMWLQAYLEGLKTKPQ